MSSMYDFQQKVALWCRLCFGDEIAGDRKERAYRFIEEAIELVQAADIPKEDVLELAKYVYDRPKGEMFQEIGGVMVTLAAFCEGWHHELMSAATLELHRITQPETVAKIREKQRSKPFANGVLPQ
jgi:hypothetical protein